jgi:hypothetical protein
LSGIVWKINCSFAAFGISENAGGAIRTEIKGFYKIHYTVITRQLPRKNCFITNERQ